MVLFLPAALLLLALFVLPVGYAFYLGFTDITLIGPTAVHFHFTGIKNVLRLGRDTLFWKSLWLTAVFLAGSVVGVTVVGMALAVLMQRSAAWLRAGVGAVSIVAWMLPPITVAVVWYAFTTTERPELVTRGWRLNHFRAGRHVGSGRPPAFQC
jgi:multiple sugar transport system permease protein